MGLTAPNSLSTDILRTSFGRETHPMKFVSSVIRRCISPVQGAVPRPCAVRGTCACSVNMGGTEHRSRWPAEHDTALTQGLRAPWTFRRERRLHSHPWGGLSEERAIEPRLQVQHAKGNLGKGPFHPHQADIRKSQLHHTWLGVMCIGWKPPQVSPGEI